MLEILLLISMCKSIGRIVREKGRSATPFQVMLVVLWLVGEFVGAVVGAIVLGGGMAIYLFALMGAAAGAIVTFVIAKNLQSMDPSTGARGFPVATYRDEI
jgi:hypothetical protein